MRAIAVHTGDKPLSLGSEHRSQAHSRQLQRLTHSWTLLAHCMESGSEALALDSDPCLDNDSAVSDTRFEDLYDVEKRPGAGVELWTAAVKLQLERVSDANLRHRRHHLPDPDEQRDDPDAEQQLHADVYFLCLAVRRVLLFHELLARTVSDARLAKARKRFDSLASDAKRFRDFYEHLDEYLMDSESKHVKIPGRAAPVLHSRWDRGNVVVSFGGMRFDVTAAALAAVELGEASRAVWTEHLEALKASRPREPDPPDDGVPRMLYTTFGVSAKIGGDDEGVQKISGTLLDVGVRECTPEELAELRAEPEAEREPDESPPSSAPTG